MDPNINHSTTPPSAMMDLQSRTSNLENDTLSYVLCVHCDRLWSALYPVLLVTGLLGNTALCVVIAHLNHALRIPTRFIIYALSSLDSITLLLSFVTRCAFY